MEGWGGRVKRMPGAEWAIVKLGAPGQIHGFEIDTRNFTGNYPPQASIEGCVSVEAIPPAGTAWTSLIPTIDLHGDSRRMVETSVRGVWTHVRLSIFPDGGVARLRVYGRIHKDWKLIGGEAELDLLAMENGGRGLIANDEHFGKVENLTAPGRGRDMGDGWETRRRREPGHDWAILELGHGGVISEITVDTAHFKGNYPDRCSIQASPSADGSLLAIAELAEDWPILLPEVKLRAEHIHVFPDEIQPHPPIRFRRLNTLPDGGVSRLRLKGRIG